MRTGMNLTLLCTTAILLMWGTVVSSVSAQVTYTVFPARVTEHALQPTHRNTGTLVTVNVQDSTIEYVIKEIARQARLQPVYDIGPLFTRRMTVRLDTMDAMDAFAAVLKGTGFIARMAADGETVVIHKRASGPSVVERSEADSNGVVAGRVTDSSSGQEVGRGDREGTRESSLHHNLG